MRSTGRRFFVHASRGQGGTTSGFGDNPDRPFTTFDSGINVIAAAVTAGTLDASDSKFIVGMPGHAETLADATSLVMDQNNISLIGDGRGAARPTLTMSATGSNIPISGAGCSISNILVTCTGTINVTAGITVTGLDCKMTDIEMRSGAADSEFVDYMVLTTGGDRCEVIRPRIFGFAGGDAEAAGISITAAIDRVRIEDAWIIGIMSAGCVENVSAATTNFLSIGGYFEQRHGTQDAAFAMHANASGFLDRPIIRTATDDNAGFDGAIVFAEGQVYDAWICNADGELGGITWGTASAGA